MEHINQFHRKLFLDYHMSKSVTNIAEGFDPKAWAEELERCGVQVISAFVRCGRGYRYYRKGTAGIIHPHLPEDMDMVGDTIRECHKKGIRVIGYLHAFGSEFYTVTDQEALAVNAEGKPLFGDRGEICPNNPLFESELLVQYEEVAANYDLDGIFFDCLGASGRVCYCKHCQERFTRDTGCKEIPRSIQDENYDRYITWLQDCYKEFRIRITEAVHRGNKDLPVCMNWGYAVRCPETVPEEIGFLAQDTWPTNMLASEQTQGKNWALAGKPYSLMNNMSLQWWASYDIKNYETLVQEAMVPVINGGRFWMGFQLYQNYTLAPFVMQTVKRVFNYIKDIEDNFNDKEIVPYIGVLNGVEQLSFRRCSRWEFDAYVDEASMYGMNKALTTSGIPYNSVLEEKLIQYLPQFKAVIIANEQYVSEDLYRELKKYVSEGGKLILTGKSGSVDCNGKMVKNSNFEELTGVTIKEESGHSYAYIKVTDTILDGDETHMPVLCAEPFIMAVSRKAKSLAKVVRSVSKVENERIDWGEFPSFMQPGEETEYDAVCTNNYGKGKVCYLAADVFRGYAGTNNWRLKALIKNLLNEVLLEDEAIRTDAPDVVELTLMKDSKNGELLINLLNTMRSAPMREMGDRLENAICEKIVPINNIWVSLPVNQMPGSVQTIQSKESLEYTYENGRLSFRLPELVIYEGIVISY